MQYTLRKAADIARAAKAAAAQIKIDAETSISVHEREPVEYVRSREKQATQRLDDWQHLIQAHYFIRGLIGVANATHGISAWLAEKARIDEEEKRLGSIVGGLGSSVRARMSAMAYGNDDPQTSGHEDDLHTLPAAITAARKRLETVTSGEARQRLTLPTFSEKALDEYRQRIQTIRQQRSDLLETIARTNVTARLDIEGETLETLRRHKLV